MKPTPYQLETLRKAAELYEGLAAKKYGLYDRRKYAFIDPTPSVAESRARAIRETLRELSDGT